jgi:hypothetical protein
MSSPATNGTSEACLYLHVFRVDEGLGNACILEFPDHSCGVLDWGTEQKEPLKKALEIARRGRVRFVTATHAHQDHTMGLPGLLESFADNGIVIEKFVYPVSTLQADEKSDLTVARKIAAKHKIPMFAISEDSFLAPPGERQPPCLAWADDFSWDVRVLSPPATRIGLSEITALNRDILPGNETSLVVLFRFQGQPVESGLGRVLLTGDATKATLRYARKTAERFPGYEIENQVFLVPHHGSENNLPEWLEPYIHGVAVISAATSSPHHPSSDVLRRLAHRTCGAGVPGLFCTNYAYGCSHAFASRAAMHEMEFVSPGSCFGDLVIRIPAAAPAGLESSSAPGHLRRRFGYCGNISEKIPVPS